VLLTVRSLVSLAVRSFALLTVRSLVSLAVRSFALLTVRSLVSLAVRFGFRNNYARGGDSFACRSSLSAVKGLLSSSRVLHIVPYSLFIIHFHSLLDRSRCSLLDLVFVIEFCKLSLPAFQGTQAGSLFIVHCNYARGGDSFACRSSLSAVKGLLSSSRVLHIVPIHYSLFTIHYQLHSEFPAHKSTYPTPPKTQCRHHTHTYHH